MMAITQPMYSEVLRTTGSYRDDEVLLFESEAKVRQVGKHALLLEKGQVARSLYYLLEGSVQQYEIASESENRVLDLHLAGEWFLNYESLIGQIPSRVFIEAFTDCRFIEISLEAVHYLTGKSIAFLQLNKVLQGALTRMAFYDQSMTPMQKYCAVLDHRPGLIQAFPLKMISSYLKMTPETLSRVKNAVANGGVS